MAILTVLGAGVSGLMLGAQHTYMAEAAELSEEVVAESVVAWLRHDLRLARGIDASNNPAITATPDGRTLTFWTFDANTNADIQVTYQFAGGTLTRTVPGRPVLDFRNMASVPVTIDVAGTATDARAGFVVPTIGTSGLVSRQVMLTNMFVADARVGNSPIDTAFGRSRFRIQEIGFDIFRGKLFE
jgi:hypothetical protein